MQNASVAQSKLSHFLQTVLEASALNLHFDLQPEPQPVPTFTIRFSGPDVKILTADNGSLLDALGHLTAASCGFTSAKSGAVSLILAQAGRSGDASLLAP